MKRIDNQLKRAMELTRKALIQLNNMNGEGKQYDFTNAPQISSYIDTLTWSANNINRIFYQE